VSSLQAILLIIEEQLGLFFSDRELLALCVAQLDDVVIGAEGGWVGAKGSTEDPGANSALQNGARSLDTRTVVESSNPGRGLLACSLEHPTDNFEGKLHARDQIVPIWIGRVGSLDVRQLVRVDLALQIDKRDHAARNVQNQLGVVEKVYLDHVGRQAKENGRLGSHPLLHVDQLAPGGRPGAILVATVEEVLAHVVLEIFEQGDLLRHVLGVVREGELGHCGAVGISVNEIDVVAVGRQHHLRRVIEEYPNGSIRQLVPKTIPKTGGFV
jgi:hypothetical protein